MIIGQIPLGIFHNSSLLIKADLANNQEAVYVDVRKSDAHNLASEVALNPIENGAKVSDHIFQHPRQLSIVFEISNSWFGKSRAMDLWNQFNKLWKERKIVEVVTVHEIYTDMTPVHVSALHTTPFKGALQFSVLFVKIDTVVLEYVQVPESQLKSDVSKEASSEINAGSQNASTISEQDGSWLYNQWYGNN
jgi:hypothetical protein